jgi:hypothetical protein
MRAVICLLALVLAAPAAVAQEVGNARRVVNTVFRGGLTSQLQTGQGVVFNEQIRTAEASATSIALSDGSFLELGANADVTLDRFVVNVSGQASGIVRMSRGTMRFVGTKVPKSIEVETPTMLIGVRGTAFNLRVANGASEIEVTDGQVTITATGQTLPLAAGQFLRVLPNQGVERIPPTAAFRQDFQRLAGLLGPPPTVTAAAPPPSGIGAQPITDASGRVVGTMTRRGDGFWEGRDLRGQVRGLYDQARDVTLTPDARVIGPGNLLATLIGG